MEPAIFLQLIFPLHRLMSRLPTGSRIFVKWRRRRESFLAAALVLFASLSPADALRVVLDPGHGGSDKGSNWYGVYEKSLNLDVAKRIEELLKEETGITTVLTRRTDAFVSLEERVAISNREGNSIFVSIHFNGHVNRSITGIETFYYGSSRGRSLATKIQSSLMSRMKTKNRGVHSCMFKVLRTTKAPAALVECGFLSNSWERNRCNQAWIRQALADQIAKGIVAYYRS